MAVTTTMRGSDLKQRLYNAHAVLTAYRTMRHRRYVAWMKSPDSSVEIRYAELKQAEMQVDAAQATCQLLKALIADAKASK